MQMLAQTAVTVPAAPEPPASIDPAGMQVNALVEQQIASITRLVQLEGDAVALERRLLSSTSTAEKTALNAELRETRGAIDGERARIEHLKKLISEARASFEPVTSVGEPPHFLFNEPRMFGMREGEFMAIFAFVLGFPLVIALARRLWKTGISPKPAPVNIMEEDRLRRLEQAVESVAIEVERIGESQRFQAKLMTEQRESEHVRR